jgi:hypothetical protein
VCWNCFNHFSYVYSVIYYRYIFYCEVGKVSSLFHVFFPHIFFSKLGEGL